MKITSQNQNQMKNVLNDLSRPITVQEIKNRKPEVEHLLIRNLFKTSPYKDNLIKDPSCNQRKRYPTKFNYKYNVPNWVPDKDGCERYLDANKVINPYENENPVSFIAGEAPQVKDYPLFARTLLGLMVPIIITIIEEPEVSVSADGYWLPSTDHRANGKPFFENLKAVSDNGFVKKSVLKVLDPEVPDQSPGSEAMKENSLLHMHLYTWKDNTAPSQAEFGKLKDLFSEISAFRASYSLQKTDFWIFVHCSAGIGRTGTFIAAYYLYTEYLKAKEKGVAFNFSVFGLTAKLRTMRYNAIVRKEQYAFLYNFIEYLS